MMAQCEVPEAADVLFQFGVAGSLGGDIPSLCHVELPIWAAASDPYYSRAFDFAGLPRTVVDNAIAGEQEFLESCDLIWTNSHYTAGLFPSSLMQKVRVHTPGVKIELPRRDWSVQRSSRVLFIGRSWELKGGPLVVEACKELRRRGVQVELTVIGCCPRVSESFVEVLGTLRMDNAVERRRFAERVSSSTVFCMPSQFETTGMVFMEAAASDLPVIMRRIPQTDAIFPDALFGKIEEPDPVSLAELLLPFLDDHSVAAERGLSIGRYTREKYGPSAFFRGVDELLMELGRGR